MCFPLIELEIICAPCIKIYEWNNLIISWIKLNFEYCIIVFFSEILVEVLYYFGDVIVYFILFGSMFIFELNF